MTAPEFVNENELELLLSASIQVKLRTCSEPCDGQHFVLEYQDSDQNQVHRKLYQTLDEVLVRLLWVAVNLLVQYHPADPYGWAMVRDVLRFQELADAAGVLKKLPQEQERLLLH